MRSRRIKPSSTPISASRTKEHCVIALGQFLEVLIGGLMSGVLYSLVALGFVLIFKASGVFPLPFARNRRVVSRRRLNDRDHHRSLRSLTTRVPSAGPAWRIATRCSRDCATPDVLRIGARKESPCAPDDEA